MLTDKKIIFWGTPLFALASLEALNELGLLRAVVTRASQPAGRGRQISDSPIKTWADQHNLPVLAPVKLDGNFVTEIKKYLPATFVIVAYGKIIKQDILDLSELPAINLHPSKLPEFRGPSPIQSVILTGQKNTAVTIMQLDAQMDHGPILAQEDIDITEGDNFLSLSEKLSQRGAGLLKKIIPEYLNGHIKPVAQDDSRATFCHLIQKEDGLIDWSAPAEVIINKIRAYNPWPSAYSKVSGVDFKIFVAKISDKKLKVAEIEIQRDQFFVGTGTLAIEILELQVAGKKIMAAADYIRGLRKK